MTRPSAALYIAGMPKTKARPNCPQWPRCRCATRGFKNEREPNGCGVPPAFIVGGKRGAIISGDGKLGEYAGEGRIGSSGRAQPWQFQVADYCVKERRTGGGKWGVYLRHYNMCLGEFVPNSAVLRDALTRMFDAAHALKKGAIARYKLSHETTAGARAEARELARWAGERIMNGPTAGALKHGFSILGTADLDEAIAKIVKRVRDERDAMHANPPIEVSVQPTRKRGKCGTCGTEFSEGGSAFAPGPAKRTRKQWREAIEATAPKKRAKKKPRHDLAAQVRALGADSLLPRAKKKVCSFCHWNIPEEGHRNDCPKGKRK